MKPYSETKKLQGTINFIDILLKLYKNKKPTNNSQPLEISFASRNNLAQV